jgi:hypothetical protein
MRLDLESVQSSRIGFQNLYLRSFTDVLSLLNFAHDEGLAVAMRHVRPEYHVVLSDELDNLGQENIVRFRAEKEIPLPTYSSAGQGVDAFRVSVTAGYACV